jgi:hypothetical protein
MVTYFLGLGGCCFLFMTENVPLLPSLNFGDCPFACSDEAEAAEPARGGRR